MTRKYGRTFHLPQSPGAASDDKIMLDTSALLAEPEVIIPRRWMGKTPRSTAAAAIRAARMRGITRHGTG